MKEHIQNELHFYKLVQCYMASQEDKQIAKRMTEYQAMAGMNFIIKIKDKIEEEDETWIAYQVGKRTLASRLYQLR